MKKKRYGLLLAGLVTGAAFLLNGCGKVTAEEIMNETIENLAEASSYTGNLSGNMGMKISQSGVSMDMGIEMDMDVEMINNPAVYHLDGNVGVDFLGMKVDMEIYGEEKDDQSIVYMYNSQEDQWSKTVTAQKEEKEELPVLDWGILADSKAKLELAKKTEKIHGEEVYVITSEIQGDDLGEAFDIMGELSEEMDDDIDLSKLEMDVTLKIYKDSKLPASLLLETKGDMDDVSIDENDMKISIENFKFEMTYDEFDTLDKIKIPKEALRADEAYSEDDLMENLTQDEEKEDVYDDTLKTTEDGCYILTNWDKIKEVKIEKPEGFQLEDYSDSHSIAFGSEVKDGYATIEYSLKELDEYYTEADIRQIMENRKKLFSKGEEYINLEYQDVKETKVGDTKISYMSLSVDFEEYVSLKSCVAWVVLPDDFVLLCSIDEEREQGTESQFDESTILKTAFEAVQFEQ